jgi:neuronal calcium sensor 1
MMVYKEFYPDGSVDEFCKYEQSMSIINLFHWYHCSLLTRYAFDTFDTNHDGTIDFNEFILAISVTSQGSLEDRLGVAFDM